MKPVDVPTRETVAFVMSHAAAAATVLEIGCGEGDVAYRAAQGGLTVTPPANKVMQTDAASPRRANVPFAGPHAKN